VSHLHIHALVANAWASIVDLHAVSGCQVRLGWFLGEPAWIEPARYLPVVAAGQYRWQNRIAIPPGTGLPDGTYRAMSAQLVTALEPESAAVRERRLAAARRRATALLVGVTVLFVAVTVAGAHGILLGYVQAGAEASMVGGVADWFAVTALFRRPLGLPIPHTALIVERKDQFAATLGQFVQENFLNADVLAERIRSARLVPRLADWLAEEANAARFAGRAADLVVKVAEALRDEDVQRVLTAELTRAVDAVEVAPLAGRALRVIIAGGHHAELFNAILSGADRYLAGHYAELRELFEG
jgi:hypothetical protein